MIWSNQTKSYLCVRLNPAVCCANCCAGAMMEDNGSETWTLDLGISALCSKIVTELRHQNYFFVRHKNFSCQKSACHLMSRCHFSSKRQRTAKNIPKRLVLSWVCVGLFEVKQPGSSNPRLSLGFPSSNVM